VLQRILGEKQHLGQGIANANLKTDNIILSAVGHDFAQLFTQQ